MITRGFAVDGYASHFWPNSRKHRHVVRSARCRLIREASRKLVQLGLCLTGIRAGSKCSHRARLMTPPHVQQIALSKRHRLRRSDAEAGGARGSLGLRRLNGCEDLLGRFTTNVDVYKRPSNPRLVGFLPIRPIATERCRPGLFR